MIAWLRGWAATLHIMIFERELYRFLRDSEFTEGDFVEVDPADCRYPARFEGDDGCPPGCTSPFCDCPGTR